MTWSALAGNPNSGKLVLVAEHHNQGQHMADYPRSTVERKEGSIQLGGGNSELVDLPGAYSLTAYSPEGWVARQYSPTEVRG